MIGLKALLLKNVPLLNEIQGAEFNEMPKRVIMKIPFADGADYGFTIIYDTVCWSVIWAHTADKSDDGNFWHQVFDRYGYMTSHKVFDDMNENIPRLLQNPTKIVQRRGIINWRFIMYAYINNAWVETSRIVSPKKLGAPKIKGRVKEYFSPKVIQ